MAVSAVALKGGGWSFLRPNGLSRYFSCSNPQLVFFFSSISPNLLSVVSIEHFNHAFSQPYHFSSPISTLDSQPLHFHPAVHPPSLPPINADFPLLSFLLHRSHGRRSHYSLLLFCHLFPISFPFPVSIARSGEVSLRSIVLYALLICFVRCSYFFSLRDCVVP